MLLPSSMYPLYKPGGKGGSTWGVIVRQNQTKSRLKIVDLLGKLTVYVKTRES